MTTTANRDMVLWPGMAIGQLLLTRLSSPAVRPYGPARGSHYQGQTGPTPSAVAEQVAARGI
jgi:dCTP deaminase